MAKKNFLVVVMLIITLLTFSRAVLALEINYPSLPGGYQITADSSLIDYIQYFFVLAMSISGAIAIMSIVFSGAQILLFAGQPWAVKEARERIFGSILGVILLLTAMTILRTINPELLTPTQESPAVGFGTYITDGNNNYREAPGQSIDTSELANFTNFIYRCDPPGRNLLLWTFNEPAFGTSNGATTIRISCGDTKQYSLGGSYFWDYEDVGIYYFQSTDCTGIMTCAKDVGSSSCAQKSNGAIPVFWSGGAPKSMRIISNNLSKYPAIQYGVILSKGIGAEGQPGGECADPILKLGAGEGCFTIPKDLNGDDFNPKFAYVIKENPFHGTSAKEVAVSIRSKDLVYTYSQSAVGDIYQCSKDPNCGGNPDSLLFSKGDSFTGDEKDPATRIECGPDDPDSPCLEDVIPNGNYYIALYSRNEILEADSTTLARDRICRIYKNPSSLSNTDLLRDSGLTNKNDRTLYDMDIIPHFPRY